MKKALARPVSTRPAASRELSSLRTRLADAEEALRAIRNGEVDTMVVASREGSQVFTLQGAEEAYRMLIESMNEGALTLAADETILYANQCFARLVQCPLEQVIGSSFRRFLSVEDRATLRPLLKRGGQAGAKVQVELKGGAGAKTAVQISLRPLAKHDANGATLGVVVRDLTEARRNEEMLRALTHRVVQAQEAERGRVALELHDNISQLLCAVGFSSEALVGKLVARDGRAKKEAIALREMLAQAVQEVERISRNLRPSVLDQMGLEAVLGETRTEFTTRTGVTVKLACVQLAERLHADIELALYRIVQEALKNVEKHARARHVDVCLSLEGAFVQLMIKDDGIGFAAKRSSGTRKGKAGLGLLGMRERAAYVSGVLTIKSTRGVGTEIEVRIPLGGGRMTGRVVPV